MTNSQKPTEAEKKEFWEWCGYKPNIEIPSGRLLNWWIPEDAVAIGELPSIDLNNLFKWAVPKLLKEGLHLVLEGFESGEFGAKFVLMKPPYSFRNESIDQDPALALFWAIWEVIHA